MLLTREEFQQITAQARLAQRTTATSRSTHSYDTFLTFISGTLVGGDYDTDVMQDQGEGVSNSSAANDVFLGVKITGINSATSCAMPTVSGVAKKIALQKGK